MTDLQLILIIIAGLLALLQTAKVVSIIVQHVGETYFLGYYLAAGLLIWAVLL